MKEGGPHLGLHLGAEYNGNHKVAGPSMNELVDRYLRDARFHEFSYFRFLMEQVRCFGDPRQFYYDDVSKVRVGGVHSNIDIYRENVRRSVAELVQVVREVQPRLIIVAGTLAFSEFNSQVLPRIPDWRGDLIKTRNPSAQGHRGRPSLWLERYRSFQSNMLSGPAPERIRKWHLLSRNAETPFRLVAL